MPSNPNVISPLLLINQRTDRAQLLPSLYALADGSFGVTWDSRVPTAAEVKFETQGRRFDASGFAISDEFHVTSRPDGWAGYHPHANQIGTDKFVLSIDYDTRTYVTLDRTMSISGKFAVTSDDYSSFELTSGGCIVHFQQNIGTQSIIMSVYSASGTLLNNSTIYQMAGEWKGLGHDTVSSFHIGNKIFSYWVAIDDRVDDQENYIEDRYYVIDQRNLQSDGRVSSFKQLKFDPVGYGGVDLAGYPNTILDITPLLGGTYAITWSQLAEYNGKAIQSVFTQVHDAKFRPVGHITDVTDLKTAVKNPDYMYEASSIKTVALPDGGYATIWSAPTSDSTKVDYFFSSYLRIMNVDGRPRGEIMNLTNSMVWNADIIVKSDGMLVVTWDSFRTEDDRDTSLTAVSAIIVDPVAGKLLAFGTASDDTMQGTNYGDRLDGRGGADRMSGGAGDDIYIVGATGDRPIEAADAGMDIVRSSVSFSLAGQDIERLVLTGSANVDGTGNGLGNRITGNRGVNILDGKGGADMLKGDGGDDRFHFTAKLGVGNVDKITDFTNASGDNDRFYLDDAIFKAFGSKVDKGEFITVTSGHAAKQDDDFLIYNSKDGTLWYDADGNKAGGADAVQFATLLNKAALSVSDFAIF